MNKGEFIQVSRARHAIWDAGVSVPYSLLNIKRLTLTYAKCNMTKFREFHREHKNGWLNEITNFLRRCS